MGGRGAEYTYDGHNNDNPHTNGSYFILFSFVFFVRSGCLVVVTFLLLVLVLSLFSLPIIRVGLDSALLFSFPRSYQRHHIDTSEEAWDLDSEINKIVHLCFKYYLYLSYTLVGHSINSFLRYYQVA